MENRSGLGQDQGQAKMGAMRINPDLLDWMGGCVPNPWSTCNLLYSLICIIPRVLITNAN